MVHTCIIFNIAYYSNWLCRVFNSSSLNWLNYFHQVPLAKDIKISFLILKGSFMSGYLFILISFTWDAMGVINISGCNLVTI